MSVEVFSCVICRLSLCMGSCMCVFLQESLLDADHHVAIALGPADKPGSAVRTQTTHLFNMWCSLSLRMCSSIRHYSVSQWLEILLLFLSASSFLSSSSHHIHTAVIQRPHRLSFPPDGGRRCLLGQLQDEGWSPTETKRHRRIPISTPLTCYTHTHTHTFQKCQDKKLTHWRWGRFLIQHKSSQVSLWSQKIKGLSRRTSLRHLTPSVFSSSKLHGHKPCTANPKI